MTNEKIDINPLIRVIDSINALHKEHSKSWLSKKEGKYNLKKTQIRNVCGVNRLPKGNNNIEIDINFIEYVNTYCDELNKIFINPIFEFIDTELEVTSRIKHPESRVSKLLHYMDGKDEEGKVSINKCLNDLLGFRVFVTNFSHDEKSFDMIKKGLKVKNIKIHNSCKGNYKATHLYFSNGNNQFFPWELQIWNYEDDKTNKSSHKKHKQSYTKWAGEHKEMIFKEVQKI